jgi:hypothetical protein
MNGRKCESKDCFKLKLGYCPFDYVCEDSVFERFRKGVSRFNEQRSEFVRSKISKPDRGCGAGASMLFAPFIVFFGGGVLC